jgi:alpha-1,3-rhamnosyl/mannosyltransferase
VSDADLPSVYSNAVGLVYPSRYEGFGLPLVEAMASGVPILASRTPINMEICEESATFFPVGEHSQLALEMSNLLLDPLTFEDKIRSGLTRSKNFTWQKCAERTADEYRKLLEKRARERK